MSNKPTREGFWSRNVLNPIRRQLTQGISPERLALGLVVGAGLGVFPILGTTTALCLVAGALLRLNQPVLQLGNWIVAAAQIPLILAFVRLGEFLVGAPPVPMAPSELVAKFQASPSAFLTEFGWAGMHGILGWTVAVPASLLLTYPVLRIAMVQLARRSVTATQDS